MKQSIVVPLLLCLGTAAAPAAVAQKSGDWAGALRAGQLAEQAGDYRKAQAHYSKLAARNPLAQLALGRLAAQGLGMPQDPVAACAWYHKAAQRHVPLAEHEWGRCLASGIGQPVDTQAALQWYEKASGHGHLISDCHAADHYVRGRGVPKDTARGIGLCTSVALAGSPPAMLQLADYYQAGTDVPQDLVQARMWLLAAAERGSAEARYRAGLMLAQGEGGDPDPDQGLSWLEAAASQGYAPAYLPTAVLYANARVDPATGALKPEHLARIYFWNSAAAARATAVEDRAQIERIAALLNQVMPPGWRPPLDRQLAEHLARFPAAEAPTPVPR